MSRIFLLGVLACLFSSCNDAQHSKTEHTHTDSGAVHSADTTSGTSMQQLMNTMMDDMHAQKSTGNNDVDFAQMMLVHHQGAVKMAELQIDKGGSEPLKEFSRNVVKTQMAEIDSFKRILAVTSPVLSGKESEFQKEMMKSMQPMMGSHNHQSKDIDTDFVELMIPHHQGAVDMAKAYLKFGTNVELKKISQSIIQTQSKEIDWLNEWLKNKK